MKIFRHYLIPLLLCLFILPATAQERTQLDDKFSVVFPLPPDTGSKNGANIWQSYTDSSESPNGICLAMRMDAKKLDINPVKMQRDPDYGTLFLKAF